MSENGIAEAEQRVREMNRVTQQYSEQGNRYLQAMMNAQNARQTRFEPAGTYPQQKSGQDNFSGNRPQNHQQQSHQPHQPQPRRYQLRQEPSRRDQQQSHPQNFQHPQNSSAIQRRNSPNPQQHCVPGSRQGNHCPAPVHTGQENHSSEIHKHPSGNDHVMGFPDIFADNEKLMLLLLMYLLIREKADIKLILALGYLLL